MTKTDFVNMLVKNHGSGKWINGTYEVEGRSVGVKAFGKWVQRMQFADHPDYFTSSSEVKTVAGFREQVNNTLEQLEELDRRRQAFEDKAKGFAVDLELLANPDVVFQPTRT
jgi:hypothetical protein